ncbi:hypothetical protein YWY31_31150 [Paenibacillus illinoisensis]
MEISLKSVTVHNWYICIQLEVAHEQTIDRINERIIELPENYDRT